MASEPIDKRLEWLDEQRRKDSETLRRLEQRLAGMEETLAKQAAQVQDLATESARLSALGSRISQFDDTLTKHRQEVSRQLESAEEARSAKEKQLEQLRKRDQSEMGKSLSELRTDLKALDQVRELMEARREQEMRISRTMDSFSKAMDELKGHDEDRGRWIISADEARRQDTKRMSELQADVSGLRTRFDTARGTLDTVEDRVRRLEVRLSEIAASDNERREGQALWMEQQNLRLVDFERGSKEWGKRFKEFEKMADELSERMVAYEETYRALKQQREDLDALMQRLERRITEVGEMQRLTEDRLKQEWATFQADDQKRWNTYKLASDELWRDHHRLHDRIGKELQDLTGSMGAALRGLADLEGGTQERINALLSLLREWAAHFERQTSEMR